MFIASVWDTLANLPWQIWVVVGCLTLFLGVTMLVQWHHASILIAEETAWTEGWDDAAHESNPIKAIQDTYDALTESYAPTVSQAQHYEQYYAEECPACHEMDLYPNKDVNAEYRYCYTCNYNTENDVYPGFEDKATYVSNPNPIYDAVTAERARIAPDTHEWLETLFDNYPHLSKLFHEVM